MHFSMVEKMRALVENVEWIAEKEKRRRWRWQRGRGGATVSCRLVSSFLSQGPREIISSQYGVSQSSQNTSLPSRYAPDCLPVSPSVYMFAHSGLYVSWRFHEHQLMGLFHKKRQLKRIVSACQCRPTSLTWAAVSALGSVTIFTPHQPFWGFHLCPFIKLLIHLWGIEIWSCVISMFHVSINHIFI